MSKPTQPLNRILVIDDNPAIYEDFCKVLCPSTAPAKELVDLAASIFGDQQKTPAPAEYQIDFALRGQEGVEKVKAANAEGWPYVIAFVDMRMPNGWGGLETIKNLWLADPQLQIVLCTAYSDYSWDEIRAQLSKRDRFLILKKPFDNIEVQQMVETLVNRQAAEQQLRLLEACISQADDVVIVTDVRPKTDGGPRIVYVNDIFTAKTGYTKEFAIGKTMDILFGPNTQVSAIDKIQKGLANKKPIRVEMVNYTATKSEFWVDVNMSPIHDKDREVTHWLWMQRDISDQKTTLDALTEKEFSVVKTVAENSEITLKEIADKLHISEHTLRNHLASIYEKLGVRGRLELYIFCSKFMNDSAK
jgi:PAS domain S-box-containing protein